MRLNLCPQAAGVALLLSAPAFAHHSFKAEYDSNKPINITGSVTKVEWMNPHARLYVDVKDKKGVVMNWDFELGSLNALKRQGWLRDSLKVGDRVTVEGRMVKDGARLAGACRVTLADGRKLSGWPVAFAVDPGRVSPAPTEPCKSSESRAIPS